MKHLIESGNATRVKMQVMTFSLPFCYFLFPSNKYACAIQKIDEPETLHRKSI